MALKSTLDNSDDDLNIVKDNRSAKSLPLIIGTLFSHVNPKYRTHHMTVFLFRNT